MGVDYHTTRRLGKAYTLPYAPAYTFGSRNERRQGDPSPGPGEYQLSLSSSTHGGNFSSSHRDSGSKDQTPSPQDYNLGSSSKHTLRGIPAHSLGASRPPDHLRNKNPGPGTYDGSQGAAVTKPSIPSFSLLAKWPKGQDADNTPAPHDYNATYNRKEAKAASLKFRHSAGTSRSEPDPGPGEYPIRRPQSQGKSFGASRNYRYLDNGVPGPGFYAPEDTAIRRRRASHSLARSNRDDIRDTGGPGPGQYTQEPVMQRQKGHSVSSLSKSAPAFSFQGKPWHSRDPAFPGPGDYGVPPDPAHRSPPAYTIKGVKGSGSSGKQPGPGAYDPQHALVRRSAASIAIGHRPEGMGKFEEAPGPGEYDVMKGIWGDKSSGVSIKGRWSIKPDNEGTPAPHDYADMCFRQFNTCCSSCGSGKGFSFARKYKERQQEDVPGPIYQIGCSTLGIAAATPILKSQLHRTVVL